MSERISNIVMTLQTTMLGVSTAVLLAGVPWAYVIHGRVSTIEGTAEDVKEIRTDIKSMAINAARIDGLERRIDRVESRMP